MTPRQGVLLGAVLVVFTAQQVLMPVLAPLAREVALSELQLGLVISLSAAMLAITSPAWGRACDRRGPRPVLLAGLGLAAVGLAGFALIGQLALAGVVTGWPVYAAMLVTRSVLFGVGLGAVPVAALAVVAAASTSTDRTAAVSRVGSMQGLSLVLGPALGGVLAFAGLLGPLWAAPAVLAPCTVAVAVLLPRATAGSTASPQAARLRVRDPRVWPYLLVGFALLLSLGLVLLSTGFLIQDRLGLSPTQTARAAGAVFFACGLVLVAVQGVLVPKLRWAPARLLRAGAPIAALGALGLAVAPGLAGISAGMILLALGLGVAQSGYFAGPGLHLTASEQGAAAGLVSATNGITFVVGPAAGAALYQLAPSGPFLAAVVVTVLGWVVVLTHPTLRGRTRSPTPVPEPS